MAYCFLSLRLISEIQSLSYSKQFISYIMGHEMKIQFVYACGERVNLLSQNIPQKQEVIHSGNQRLLFKSTIIHSVKFRERSTDRQTERINCILSILNNHVQIKEYI